MRADANGDQMTEQSAPTAGPGAAPRPAARLEPDAIGVVQDTVIGMASSAPAATVGLSLAALAIATAYGSGPILILTAIPMLIIANAYRRCNLWNANAGASFEWVGRAINPYLGWLTGWLMIAAYIIGTVAEVLLLGPSVLAVFGSSSTNTWAYVGIGCAMGLIMLVVAVIGIKITARVQVSMALVEYLILIGLAVAGLVWVLGHHPGTVPITKGWLSVSGIGGKGSAVAGFLVAVFVYGGWDGTLYVNEEVRHRRVNPGRAAIMAVALLAIIYTLAQVGFQGVVSPAKLQKASDSGTALVYVANALGGGFWAKAMALSIALSVIATTGTGIVLSARIVYGMASYRALPPFLGNVSRRYATPVAASIIVGVLIVGLSAVYFLATSVQNAFYDVIDVTGLLFSIFYILTALAAIVYYRRRVFSSPWDLLVLGLLPFGAAVFLGWILEKSLLSAPAVQVWSMVGIVGSGLILMLCARFILQSEFFQMQRESYVPRRTGRH
jgi:amino acid transporter